jgi:hypothetical protein
VSRADDDLLGREHGAFLASVLGHRYEREDDGPRLATAEELALHLGRGPERELTADDVCAWRATPHDPQNEREPSTEATPEDVASFAAALRANHQR